MTFIQGLGSVSPFYPLQFLHLALPLSRTSFMVFLHFAVFAKSSSSTRAICRMHPLCRWRILACRCHILACLPFPGMSLPSLGMSAPFPGMSLPFPGMSLPFPGLSLLPYSGMSSIPAFSTGRHLSQSHRWSHLHRPHNPPRPRPQQCLSNQLVLFIVTGSHQ